MSKSNNFLLVSTRLLFLLSWTWLSLVTIIIILSTFHETEIKEIMMVKEFYSLYENEMKIRRWYEMEIREWHENEMKIRRWRKMYDYFLLSVDEASKRCGEKPNPESRRECLDSVSSSAHSIFNWLVAGKPDPKGKCADEPNLKSKLDCYNIINHLIISYNYGFPAALETQEKFSEAIEKIHAFRRGETYDFDYDFDFVEQLKMRFVNDSRRVLGVVYEMNRQYPISSFIGFRVLVIISIIVLSVELIIDLNNLGSSEKDG